jgi:uncharacterized membrane protein
LKNSYLYSALVAAVSISIANADNSTEQSDREKCWGVAKAGENDCGGYSEDGEKQTCQGWTTKDNDPYAWSYVKKGTCPGIGGKLNPPPRPRKPQSSDE